MIINLKKVVFIGIAEDLIDFLLTAQEKGCVEFISSKGKAPRHYPKEVQNMIDAIKVLRKLPQKSVYRAEGDLHFADELTQQILDLRSAMDKYEEEKRLLEAEIARVAPFGPFSMEDIAFIEMHTGRKVQFFCVKASKRETVQGIGELIYVGTDYDLDYFIAINSAHKSYPGMIEMHVDRSVNELKSHHAFLDETLQQIHAELKGFTGYVDYLRDKLLERLDIYSLDLAHKNMSFPLEGRVFAVEAWVPENKMNLLPSLIQDHAIIYEKISVEEGEKMPTYMENKGANRIGEDLVRIYDIPDSKDKDPSGWVLWAFIFFFSMIVGDGGYGLIYLAFAILLKFKMPNLAGGKRRFMKLMFILGSSCVVWGLLTSSFFGLSLNPKGIFGKISITTYLAEKKAAYHLSRQDAVYKEWAKEYPAVSSAKSGKEMVQGAVKTEKGRTEYPMRDEFTDNILLEVSLLAGVIHICLSMIRYGLRNWANFGWAIFIIGGFFYFPGAIDSTSMINFLGVFSPETAAKIGMQMIYVGGALALILAFAQKRLKGISEIFHIVQIFSDILSYLRLYALALAGALIARTFNGMGADVHFILGALIILAGHSLNLLLSTMAGVIHGLRLNFIEWYHYCFEGNGRLFRPLRKLKKVG